MSIRALLTSMVQQVEGAYAVMLMGYDCIPLMRSTRVLRGLMCRR